ncbi:unnamed protein product [Rhizophagus irregularis]|nr:unnamed protein product [Rhizophagus irregularis]
MTRKKVGVRQRTSYSLEEKLIVVKLQMCKILKESSIQALYPAGEYEFQGNLSWINSFMKRFGLSLRRRTKISQKLPEDLEEKLDEFR